MWTSSCSACGGCSESANWYAEADSQHWTCASPSGSSKTRRWVVTPLRDVLEHLDDAAVRGQGGIGYGLGLDGVNVTCDGAEFDTAALLESARTLHRAIRSTADPIYCPRPGREGGTELRLRLGQRPWSQAFPQLTPQARIVRTEMPRDQSSEKHARDRS